MAVLFHVCYQFGKLVSQYSLQLGQQDLVTFFLVAFGSVLSLSLRVGALVLVIVLGHMH